MIYSSFWRNNVKPKLYFSKPNLYTANKNDDENQAREIKKKKKQKQKKHVFVEVNICLVKFLKLVLKRN